MFILRLCPRYPRPGEKLLKLSPDTYATLLLAGHLGRTGGERVNPLSPTEWGRFAAWLKEQSITPAALLDTNPGRLLNGWRDKSIDAPRILQLLRRRPYLVQVASKWNRANLWVLGRSDPEYPRRLKLRLRENSPPLLFGRGDKSVLNKKGLAVVGSIEAHEEDLLYASKAGAKAASSGVIIISGSARGIDESAMLGAINNGGVAVGIMANGLLKAATSPRWRENLVNGKLVLISPFNPEASPSTGSAMARNKYIYCMADSSLVVHSRKKSGTINGAKENLKNKWVTLWVKPTSDEEAANDNLVRRGGRWCEDDIEKLNMDSLFTASTEPDTDHRPQTQPGTSPQQG